MTLPCTQFTIFGERCSGTNYLELLITANFHINVTWEYGWKHMRSQPTCRNSKTNETLFIGVIRNEIDWLNSFKRSPYHVPDVLSNNLSAFLFDPFYSVINNKIIERANNIFDLRARKNKYLKETMPTLVNNYMLFQYEEISKNYESILTNLQLKFNLKPKNNKFKNITSYKKYRHAYVPTPNQFTYADIQELAKKRGMILDITDAPDGTSILKLDAVADAT